MAFWLLLAGSFLLVGLLLFLDGRRREEAVARDWELILTPRGKRLLGEMEASVRTDLELADITCAQAEEARAAGRLDDALRLLDEGCTLIEEFSPRMVHALGAMAVLSRMAAAIAPVRPLRPEGFKLAQLAQLAHVSRFFHHLLVSTAERFRLRVFLLQRGFRTVALLAVRWRRPAPEWNSVSAVRHDTGTLTDEALLTFRILLVSLDAERRRA